MESIIPKIFGILLLGYVIYAFVAAFREVNRLRKQTDDDVMTIDEKRKLKIKPLSEEQFNNMIRARDNAKKLAQSGNLCSVEKLFGET